ncbi:mannitol dehydrogenase family protein [Roseobacteraceae bacterium S113]
MKDHEEGMGPVKLSDANLAKMPEGVVIPHYDRSTLTPGIIHVGLGNFHRAHQAWYLHRLMQQGLAQDWAIIGAGVRPNDAVMRARLLGQDCLTTLIELDPDGTSIEITGAMIDFLPVEQDNAALIEAMSNPAIRIVALTVTEGGYYRNAAGDFDMTHADILHDAENPEVPRTVFGAIVAAFARRRADGTGPFTGLCCDNLQHNGDVMRNAVLGLARMRDPDLADWIARNATFPNGMVDCIVPATGTTELAFVRDLGIDDAAPVTHENFRQWVIEDKFCAGRPAWEKVGATLTDQVALYEAMKIRMLNAGHQVLANLGELAGEPTIAACMANPVIAAFFRKVEAEEIAPHVTSVPGMTPAKYIDLIEARFANPKIHDTTRRVAFDGSSRHPGFVLPIVRDALAQGADISGLALTEALWARMCAGTRDDGSVIEANDPNWENLQTAALAAKDAPGHWLAQRHIYDDLGENAAFAKVFEHWLALIWTKGSMAAVRTYLSSS